MSEKWDALATKILVMLDESPERASLVSNDHFLINAGNFIVSVLNAADLVTFEILDFEGELIDAFTDTDLTELGCPGYSAKYAQLFTSLERHRSGADAAIDDILVSL
jgi:hypothetical protein